MTAPAVSLGAINFDDAADANGAKWIVTEIEGWDSPTVRQSVAPRPGAHGVIVAESLYGHRSLVLAGNCLATSDSAFWESKARLSAEIPPDTATLLKITDSSAKRISVRRAGEIRTRTMTPLRSFDFEVPLLAADPRKYAETESSDVLDGSAVVVGGTATTAPRIEVVGAAAGPFVFTRGGRTVEVATSLTGGQVLVVDFGTGVVTKAGSSIYSLVDQPVQWWELAPGNNTITYTGGGTATIYWRNAWL